MPPPLDIIQPQPPRHVPEQIVPYLSYCPVYQLLKELTHQPSDHFAHLRHTQIGARCKQRVSVP
jgi:hypothetical protein